MALKDLLTAPPPQRPGAWDRLLAAIDDEDRAALEAAMRNPDVPTNHILRALRAAGHRVGSNTVYETRHVYLEGLR